MFKLGLGWNIRFSHMRPAGEAKRRCDGYSTDTLGSEIGRLPQGGGFNSYETFLNLAQFRNGGEGGIRTLDTLPYTHFPGVRLRPLGHLSVGEEFSKQMPALHTSNSESGPQKDVPISKAKWNFSEDCGPFKSR